MQNDLKWVPAILYHVILSGMANTVAEAIQVNVHTKYNLFESNDMNLK